MKKFLLTALTLCLTACLAGALARGQGKHSLPEVEEAEQIPSEPVKTNEIPAELLAPDTEINVKFIVRSARKTETKLILNSEKEWTAPGNKCVVLPYDKHPKMKQLNVKAFGLREYVVEATGKPVEYKRDGKAYPQVEVTDPIKVTFKEAPRLQR